MCDLYINKGNKMMCKRIFRIINTPSVLARIIVFFFVFQVEGGLITEFPSAMHFKLLTLLYCYEVTLGQ